MGELKADEANDLISKLKGETSANTKAEPIEEDEEEEYEYDVSEEEEKKAIKKEKPIKEDYNDVIKAMPELKQDLDYLLIMNKLKAGKEITPKENEFRMVYEDAKRKEQMFAIQQQQKMEEEELRQKELQEQTNKEYEEFKKLHPETIEVYDDKSISLKGSDNFLKVAMTFMALKKSKKKGGKIFIKVARPKKVSIEWTTQDIRFVEFWSTNERGDKVKEVSRVNQYSYTFEGTSIPVIFAIQGFAEAWDFYSEFKKDLSSEVVSGIAMEAYNTGYKDGLVVSDKKKGSGLLAFLTEFMPLILVIGLLAIGYILYQNYQSMNEVYHIVQALQTQLTVAAPGIIRDANTIILR